MEIVVVSTTKKQVEGFQETSRLVDSGKERDQNDDAVKNSPSALPNGWTASAC
jgi:hypothetical protein